MAIRRRHRHRITIQEATTDISPMGASYDTWSDIAALTDLPAGFEVVRGMEHFRGRQVQADVWGVFTIRLQPTEVSPRHRVKHLSDSNKIYEIAAAYPTESRSGGGAFREVDIHVRAIDP